MHLFSSERPEVSPNQKALLVDGGAIPYFTVRFRSNGLLQLSALLRCYDDHGGYSYHNADLSVDELRTFLTLFTANPEETLSEYFNWTAKTPRFRDPQLSASPQPSDPALLALADELL